VLILSVIGLPKVKAEVKTNIQVLVTFGDSYADVLGTKMAAEAKSLAEFELVNSLQDQIRYFQFVPSETQATYRLKFHIDNPPTSSSIAMNNIHDYYLFVSLKQNNTQMVPTLDWLFRDAGSNLNGADSALSIAQLLSNQVKQRHNNIVAELLSQVSFTNNATFNNQGRVKGWLIKHSAKALCLYKRSKLRITSIVPEGGYEDEFDAEVKKHPDDHFTTFTTAKDQANVTSLLDDPDKAKVLAVHVISYERQCEQPALTETSPTAVSFVQGDDQ
jgi:hypothetical protein